MKKHEIWFLVMFVIAIIGSLVFLGKIIVNRENRRIVDSNAHRTIETSPYSKRFVMYPCGMDTPSFAPTRSSFVVVDLTTGVEYLFVSHCGAVKLEKLK